MRGLLTGLLLGLTVLTGCTSAEEVSFPGGVQRSSVRVDTPELRELRRATDLEPCRPGPGGSALPHLTLPCLGGGRDVDLSTLRGPMLISLWASNCVPCRTEMPALQAFYDRYGDQVPVLGIDFSDTFPGTALEQVATRGVRYPMLADPGGDLRDTAPFRRVNALPFLAFVDSSGEIAYGRFGGVSSPEDVAELVREHLGLDL